MRWQVMKREGGQDVSKQLKLNATGVEAAREVIDEGGRLEDALSAYLAAEMRAVGFTSAALDLPKDDLGLVMMAAWCNVRPEQLPFGARFNPNGSSEQAWARVGRAAIAYLRERDDKST